MAAANYPARPALIIGGMTTFFTALATAATLAFGTSIANSGSDATVLILIEAGCGIVVLCFTAVITVFPHTFSDALGWIAIINAGISCIFSLLTIGYINMNLEVLPPMVLQLPATPVFVTGIILWVISITFQAIFFTFVCTLRNFLPPQPSRNTAVDMDKISDIGLHKTESPYSFDKAWSSTTASTQITTDKILKSNMSECPGRSVPDGASGKGVESMKLDPASETYTRIYIPDIRSLYSEPMLRSQHTGPIVSEPGLALQGDASSRASCATFYPTPNQLVMNPTATPEMLQRAVRRSLLFQHDKQYPNDPVQLSQLENIHPGLAGHPFYVQYLPLEDNGLSTGKTQPTRCVQPRAQAGISYVFNPNFKLGTPNGSPTGSPKTGPPCAVETTAT
ncbi:hypothetical protein BDZ91DRAFT_764472 [Kalaharituber pfeilii]|nr:hypothetical protein BDZ91DRAFT_764472 [Kalaharituber pfeilii]